MKKLIILLLLLISIPSHAADWYVDKANDGGTENGTAWATAWGKFADIVWASVGAGDTIWIRGGNYAEEITMPTGEQVSIKIDPNATTQAVFNGMHFYNNDNSSIDGYISETYKYMFKATLLTTELAGSASVVNIRLCNAFTMKGVEITREDDDYLDDADYQQHGIRVWNESGPVTIDTCHIHHHSGDGVNISQPVYTGMSGTDYSWFTVKYSYIHDVGDDGVQLSASYVSIFDNIFDQNAHAWMFNAHPDGIQTHSGNLDGVTTAGYYKFYNNVIKGFNQNIFIEYVRQSVYAYNNILIGSATMGDLSRGFNISAHEEFSGDFVLANNSIYNMLDFMGINGGAPVGGLIQNNIFVNCKLISADASLEAFIDNSNLWWDIAGVQFYDSEGNPVDPPADRREGSAVSNDPEFNSCDATSGFRLSASSPAINAGTDLSTYFTTDKNGNTRTGTWDIGAYEYIAYPTAVIGQGATATLGQGATASVGE